MKKFNKMMLIISLVFFIFGVIGCSVGAVMGASYINIGQMITDGKFQLNGGKSEKKVFSKKEAESMRNLDIQIDAGEVHIYKTTENEIRVEADGVSDSYRCELDEKELEIKDKGAGNFLSNLIHMGAGKIDVYLPETMEFKEVYMNEGAGEITVDRLKCENFSLNVGAGSFKGMNMEISGDTDMQVGAGEIKAQDCKANNVSLNCGVGSLSLAGSISGDADAKCGIGEIDLDLTGAEKDHNYSVKAVGDVKINGSKYSGVSSEKQVNNNASSNFKLKCGLGSIKVTTEN